MRANTVSDMPDPDDERALGDRPVAGRVFEGGTRPVRFADVHPTGRIRLDAVARYLQDLSADDTVDAALPGGPIWVVRRTVAEVDLFPRYLEGLTLATWCSGIGSHYAERTSELVGARGGRVRASSLWVATARETGRPVRVSPEFEELYGSASGGRRVRASLWHGDPPEGLELAAWPLRVTDFDLLQHVNNSVTWAVVEEACDGVLELVGPLRAEVEHRTAIDRGATVSWGRHVDDRGVSIWLVADGAVVSTARVVAR